MGKHYRELTPGHSNLIGVPFQNNRDFGISPSDVMRYLVVNVQPVIPLSISSLESDTRTILPIIHAESATSGGGDVGGSPVFLYSSALVQRCCSQNNALIGHKKCHETTT